MTSYFDALLQNGILSLWYSFSFKKVEIILRPWSDRSSSCCCCCCCCWLLLNSWETRGWFALVMADNFWWILSYLQDTMSLAGSKLIWTILLGVLLCDLILSASAEADPKKHGHYRPRPQYHRPRPHPHPHPHGYHCPKPKPVPCKPSPCKPVPCQPVPCKPVPCKPTAKPVPATAKPCSAPRPSSPEWANRYEESFIFQCQGEALLWKRVVGF